MPRPRRTSAIVTLRVPASLNRSIERAAQRRRRTKSELVREILEDALRDQQVLDPAEEARRQSLLVSRRRSEKEALGLVTRIADRRGWR